MFLPMLYRASFGHMAWPRSPEGGEGGGGGGGDTDKRLTHEQLLEQATIKLRAEGDAVKVIAELMNENFKLREKSRAFASVTREDIADLPRYRALGSIEELAKIGTELVDHRAYRQQREQDDHVRRVAMVGNLNEVVLSDLAKARGLNFSVKDVTVQLEGGKSETRPTAFVVTKQGDVTAEVPIQEYIDVNLADHKATLVKKAPPRADLPNQSPAGASGDGSSVLNQYLEGREKAAGAVRNPLQPQPATT